MTNTRSPGQSETDRGASKHEAPMTEEEWSEIVAAFIEWDEGGAW